MATAKKRRKRRTRKRKGKVKVTQKAEIRQKSDTTATDSISKAKTELYRDNGANFKITIRKKRN